MDEAHGQYHTSGKGFDDEKRVVWGKPWEIHQRVRCPGKPPAVVELVAARFVGNGNKMK